ILVLKSFNLGIEVTNKSCYPPDRREAPPPPWPSFLADRVNRQAAQGNEAGTNVNNQGQPGNPRQYVLQGMQILLGAALAIPTQHLLRSLQGYQPNQPSNGAERSPAVELPSSARGVPLPAALAVVMRHAQRLLSGPHTARRLEEEENITDPTAESSVQAGLLDLLCIYLPSEPNPIMNSL
ncbi:hypothetical protein M8C21_011651, partial [Ambrosia artemisiifolia]